MAKDALWLLRTQWMPARLGFAMTVVFYAAYGGLTGYFSNEMLMEMDPLPAIMMDVLFVTFMSCNAFFWSKTYLNTPYWKTDLFTNKLAALRTLPIPVETLAFSRLLQILFISPMMTVAFFVPFYMVSGWAQAMNPMAFTAFALIWFAFGTVCSGWFMLMEWGTSGRNYLYGTLLVSIIFIVGGTAITIASGSHLVIGLAEAIQGDMGWIWLLLALAMAAGLQWMLQRRLRVILSRRDFL